MTEILQKLNNHEPLTLDEISQCLDIPREWVRQIKKRALRKLARIAKHSYPNWVERQERHNERLPGTIIEPSRKIILLALRSQLKRERS